VKVFERVLKLCVGKMIRVNYGRCSTGSRVSKCSLEGVLLAFDNLCLVIAVPNSKGGVEKLVVIKKSEIESIELLDRGLIVDVYRMLSE